MVFSPKTTTSTSAWTTTVVLLFFARTTLLSANGEAYYTMPGSPEWTQLESDGAFASLAANLSSADILQRTVSPMETWIEQCSGIFQAEGFPLLDVAPFGIENGSNYQLYDQDSGLCADHLSCAYVGCQWPFVNGTIEETDEAFASGDVFEELFNLPAYVVHARTPGDVATVLSFASQHNIGISVKTSGHSYVGASTSRGSILIHMARFTKYTDDMDTALIDCSDRPNDNSNVCRLAIARGVPAALRVGGSQNWDQVYRAVHDYNSSNNTNVTTEYHIVGAAAGTVSACGGWLSGGGLSGTTGMRMFGFGVDQILGLEMVLANAWHVRFGPSDWEEQDESLAYPRTTAVEGQCNPNPASDMDEWVWRPCPSEDIDFMDLWYAVRGGAGGYGVVTAAVYQLHQKPGPLQLLVNAGVPDEIGAQLTQDEIKNLKIGWIDFLVDFFFDPTALNVSNAASNSCGSPAVALTMDPFVSGSVYCHNGTGAVMLNAWRRVLPGLGLDDNLTSAISGIFSLAGEFEDIVENNLFAPNINPVLGNGVPAGSLFDYPIPNVVPTYFGNDWNALLPKSWILNKEKSIPFLYDYISRNPLFAKMFYVLGGQTSVAHDQMTSISTSQREASFLIPTEGYSDFTSFLLTEMYGNLSAADFPGGSEYNHIGVNEFGPLKDDWTEPCPMSWTRQEKVSKCMSIQESVWGTATLSKLEEIKSTVDPSHLFNCFACVGFVEQDAQPDSSSTSSAENKSLHVVLTLVLVSTYVLSIS